MSQQLDLTDPDQAQQWLVGLLRQLRVTADEHDMIAVALTTVRQAPPTDTQETLREVSS
jgi:hypothetical protein